MGSVGKAIGKSSPQIRENQAGFQARRFFPQLPADCRIATGSQIVNIFAARMSFYSVGKMMGRFNLIFAAGFLFLAAMNPGGAARAASFTASLDPDAIALGETTTLALTFAGGQPKNVPTPNVPGLQFTQIGNSQNFSIINGAMNSAITITFSVTPQHAGEFIIPTLTVDVDGNQLTNQPVKLTVAPPGTATTASNSGSQTAFATLTLPKKEVYAGETIVADLQIYYRSDTQLIRDPRLAQNPWLTAAPPTDGFTMGKTALDDQRQVQIGNAIFNMIPVKIALTAVKAGTLSIGPVGVGLWLAVPSNNGQQDPLYRQLGLQMREPKQFSVATESVTAQALPPPAENRPANYGGAVGNYTMTAAAGPTNLTAGDPITLRVQISGRGALDTVTLPDLSAWNGFKTYPPTSKVETSDPLGLEGTKTFEQIITPQNSDVHELPQFSFSFFNPDDGKYHILTHPPAPLVVRTGGTTGVPAIAANKNSANENQTAPDILPIKEDLGTPSKNSAPLISRPVFLAAQTLPILVFLAAFIRRKRADNLANNPRLRRKIAVEKLMQNGISDLRKFAAENNSEEFFALLFRLLQEQLGERLDCPATAITENVVEENSILRGALEIVRNDLRELFQLCNQARYAPVRGTAELNSVAAQFEKVVGELQNLKT
jgi:hypothetical protein